MEEEEKEPKWLKTGVISTKSGKEIEVRWTPVYDEVGIIDRGQFEKIGGISIYWEAKDTDKIIKKLREVLEWGKRKNY